MRARSPVRLLGLVLAATGCAREAPHERSTVTDPAIAAAIEAPLMTDPDLVSLSRRFAVVSDPGPIDGSLPPDDFAPATVERARAEAVKLVGGAKAAPLGNAPPCRACTALTLAERIIALNKSCSGVVQASIEWSLRLPDDLPIYPAAHLRDAAGSDAPHCAMRSASFSSPVPAGEVLSFYRAVGTKAGFTLSAAGDNALFGRKEGRRFAALVRPQADGPDHFDLVVLED